MELEKELAFPGPIYKSDYLTDVSETYLPGDLESGCLDMPTWNLEKWIP